MAILAFSAQRIQGQIRQIEEQTLRFEKDIDAHCNATALVDSVPSAEALHRRVTDSFNRVKTQIETVRAQTGAELQAKKEQDEKDAARGIPTRPEVRREYDAALIPFTSISDLILRTEQAFTRFTDSLLTRYPTAKIEYGRAIIEAKEPANIDTNNQRILGLLNNYATMRKIRGDGNCFVSGFCTLFLETLIKENRFNAFYDEFFNDRTGDRIPELRQNIMNILLNIQEYPGQLENVLKDNQKMLCLIAFFRHLAADEMKSHKNDFEAFYRAVLEHEFRVKNVDGRSFESLVDEYTVGMGHDFSHPSIQALCHRLNFNVFIVDVRSAEPLIKILDKGEVKGVLCRNGQHYFVLYPTERAVPAAAAPQPAKLVPTAPVPQPAKAAPVVAVPHVKGPTDIAITCKVPFGHSLYIRGNIHPGMSWEKGIPLINVHGDEWHIHFDRPLRDGEYKFMIDNEHWAKGANHQIAQGKLNGVNPQFDLPSDFYATRVTIKCNANGNKLFIRGNGAGLSWDKGVELRPVNGDTWVWDTGELFEDVEFKILLGDNRWEITDQNHQIEWGQKQEFTPKF